MNPDVNVLYVLIVGCEIAFWLMLFLGISIRYVLEKTALSVYVLACVPLIDVFLLLFTVLDLSNGSNASFAHGLAAAYIGFTVAFGSTLVAWADSWFAHKFSDGPRPSPTTGWALVVEDFRLWFRCIAAVGIIYMLLVMMIEFVGDTDKTDALQVWFRIPFFTVFFWFVFGPLWSLIFFKRVPRA